MISLNVPEPPAVQVREKLLLWSLAAINFTHIVDFMIMMPLGPQLTRLFAISDAQFGVLVSAYSLAAGCAGLLASLWVDRFERRRSLLFLYAGFTVATLACGMATTYAALMAARVAAGVFGGILGALVQTIVGDAIPFERRGQAMGVVMSAFSASTVAGVPLSLWLASIGGWHWPFIAIAVVSVMVWVVAGRTVPPLDSHLHRVQTQTAWIVLRQVMSNLAYWRAFVLSCLMVAGSFSIIPYITIYTTANVGLTMDQVPWIYLVGGLATLFSARLWGVLSDRWGKLATFRLVSALAMVPMMVLTVLPPAPLWVVLWVTTGFFVFVSGRMIPGMALLTAVPAPAMRGAFMSVNGALQSATMGAASWLGGVLISRTPDGQVQGYVWCGAWAVVTSLLMWWWVGRLTLHSADGRAAQERN